jgi:hypothetical protein
MQSAGSFAVYFSVAYITEEVTPCKVCLCCVPSVIYVPPKNGRFQKTMCVHQVLLQTGKNCHRNSEMLKLATGDETMSRTQTSDWFSKFKSEVTSVDVEC